jgi:3-oxosteroid 1-dehydrogenase
MPSTGEAPGDFAQDIDDSGEEMLPSGEQSAHPVPQCGIEQGLELSGVSPLSWLVGDTRQFTMGFHQFLMVKFVPAGVYLEGRAKPAGLHGQTSRLTLSVQRAGHNLGSVNPPPTEFSAGDNGLVLPTRGQHVVVWTAERSLAMAKQMQYRHGGILAVFGSDALMSGIMSQTPPPDTYSKESPGAAVLDDEADVIVLGSGAAGLVSALAAAEAGARVILLEKASLIGGSTALSGGACWLPDPTAIGSDSSMKARSDAAMYLRSLAGGGLRDDMVNTFVQEAGSAFSWLSDSAGIRWIIVPGYPDYHPENPGGLPGGGRTVEPDLFSYRTLGPWSDLVVRSRRSVHLRLTDTALGGGTGHLDDETRQQREQEDLRGCGAGLVGPLLAACLDRGVRILIDSPAEDLLMGASGVEGVRARIGGQTRLLRAGAIVLATGGFEWNDKLVRAFLRGPMHGPAGIPTNTGDGLTMAMRAGAALANMPHAWWVPVTQIPGDETLDRQRSHLILRERTLPRGILVNRRGERFTNEAASYNALGAALHEMDTASHSYSNLPCWLVFDQGLVDRYGFLDTRPGESLPDWIPSATTLEALADLIGVDPQGLHATVDRFNSMVASGADIDFARGSSAYDRWSGDPALRDGSAATLGPLDEPPFHAIEILSGTLGTCGGPEITIDGEVLDTTGSPIPGFFAAGNVAEAPTGAAYAGAGGTLGPIITFARRAGQAAADAGCSRKLTQVR